MKVNLSDEMRVCYAVDLAMQTSAFFSFFLPDTILLTLFLFFRPWQKDERQAPPSGCGKFYLRRTTSANGQHPSDWGWLGPDRNYFIAGRFEKIRL